MFFQISNSVGSGKTQAVLEFIEANRGPGYLYVCPTIALCEEVYRRLLLVMAGHPRYVNFGPIRQVVTDPNIREQVFPRALQACRDFDPNLPPIVIVTTKTFEHLLGQLRDDEKARFHVFIDEGLPAIVQEQFSPEDPEIFLRYFHQDEDGFLSAAPEQQEILEWVAHSPERLRARQLDHLNVSQFRSICQMIVSGNYDVYMAQTERSIEVIGMLSPELVLPPESGPPTGIDCPTNWRISDGWEKREARGDCIETSAG